MALAWLFGKRTETSYVDLEVQQQPGLLPSTGNVPHAQPQIVLSDPRQEPVEPLSAPADISDAAKRPHGFRLADFKGDIEAALLALSQLEPEERGTSWLINDVAEALREEKRFEEAKGLFAGALAARRVLLGDQDPATLTSLNNLGLLLREMGELDEARELLAEAVETRRQCQGDQHPETLTALNNLGALLKARGELDEAAPLYEEALATRRVCLGDTHPDTLTSINNLASLYRALGKLQEAEVLLFEAATTAQRVLGADHTHTRIFTTNLKAVRHALNPTRIFTEPTQQTSRKAFVAPRRRRAASAR